MSQNQLILPIFDSIKSLDDNNALSHLAENHNLQDIEQAKNFLKAYKALNLLEKLYKIALIML